MLSEDKNGGYDDDGRDKSLMRTLKRKMLLCFGLSSIKATLLALVL